MKILLFANSFENYSNFRLSLIKKLIDKKFNVYLIISYDEVNKFEIQKINYVRIKFKRHNVNIFSELMTFYNLYKVYKKIRPDYALHFTIKPNIYGSIICRILKIKNINNVTGLGTVFLVDKYKKIYLYLYKLAFKKSFHVFFQNQYDQRFFKLKKIVKNNSSIIPGSGINLHSEITTELPDKNSLNFLFIGRLIVEKGLIEYLIAAKKILNKYKNINFHIIGKYDETNSRNIKKIYFENFLKNKNIHFHGYKKNLDHEMKHYHCIVLPSYREGLSHSLLTACKFSKPLIVSNVPGCKELVVDGYNGFKCLKKNPDSLADAFEKFIALPYIERIKFGERSRKIVVDNFDENYVIDKYLNIIK